MILKIIFLLLTAYQSIMAHLHNNVNNDPKFENI